MYVCENCGCKNSKQDINKITDDRVEYCSECNSINENGFSDGVKKMKYNKEEYIEVSWFGSKYDGKIVIEPAFKDLIIKTYNLQIEYNGLGIDEQHNDTYIVCKLKNGIELYSEKREKEAFNNLNDNTDYIYLWDLEYILEDMIKKGVLERGNYLISYSW